MGPPAQRVIIHGDLHVLLGDAQARGRLAHCEGGVLGERGGVWFGWSGKSVRGDSGELHEQRDGDIHYLTIDLNREDLSAYYDGFSNRTLWPLLHFRLDLVDYDRGHPHLTVHLGGGRPALPFFSSPSSVLIRMPCSSILISASFPFTFTPLSSMLIFSDLRRLLRW